MALTGNKGEWSEIYTLFKLLGDQQVFAGDEDLKKIENLFYPIIKILRKEQEKSFEYEIKGNLVFISGGEEELKIPIETFKEQAAKLLEEIKKDTKSSFSIPEIETFMASVHCKKMKADSCDKADIRIIIHDLRTKTTPLLGFSIKSQLGNYSTLLNAGKTTNFKYKIENLDLSDEDISRINSINTKKKIRDRVTEIQKLGGNLVYSSMQNSIFKNNLTLIDSLLPEIVADSLLIYYTSSYSSVKDIVNLLEKENPLEFDKKNDHLFYEYKYKRLLTDVALGMRPSTVWDGKYDANGGYLIVKEDGDIVCYHIYDKLIFENYLFSNTGLETASSTRHEFGTIEKSNNELYFKLNLQIRFNN